MEASKGKYASGNKDFFMKMRAQAMAKKADGSDADKASEEKTADDATKKTPPPVATRGIKRPPAVAAKPTQSSSTAASNSQDAKQESQADLEEQRKRLEEKEAYERAKKKMLEEEEAKRKEEEEKQRKKDEKMAALRKLQEERKQKEQEEAAKANASEEPTQGADKDGDTADASDADGAEKQSDVDAPKDSSSSQEETQQENKKEPPREMTAEEKERAAKTIKCEAIVPYKAKAEGELSFEKGDVIFVPRAQKTDAKFLIGVCKSKSGRFPGHFVVDMDTEQRLGDPSLHFKMGVKCYAVGNYVAKKPGEVSFNQGDTFYVPVLSNATMIQVVHNGKVGLVPRRFVVDEEERQRMNAKAAEVTIIRCQAIRAFNGPDDSWLSFAPYDIILIPKFKDGDDVQSGVFKGNVGKFYYSYTVDTATHTKEKIDELAAKYATVTPAPAQQQQQQQQGTADPFAVPTTVDPFAVDDRNDPFAPQDDPFAIQPSAVDPFAPQPMRTSQGSVAAVDPFAVSDSVPVQQRPPPPPQQQQQQQKDEPRRRSGQLPTIDASAFETLK